MAFIHIEIPIERQFLRNSADFQFETGLKHKTTSTYTVQWHSKIPEGIVIFFNQLSLQKLGLKLFEKRLPLI